MPDEEPKLFIDESWKAKVQREKETARQEPDPAAKAEEVAEAPEEALDPASFIGLVSQLATQVMWSLGLLAPQGTKEVMVDLDEAKILLDTLAMLHEKTKGNLEKEEEGRLVEALSQLNEVYLLRVQQFQEASMRDAGIDLNKLKP